MALHPCFQPASFNSPPHSPTLALSLICLRTSEDIKHQLIITYTCNQNIETYDTLIMIARVPAFSSFFSSSSLYIYIYLFIYLFLPSIRALILSVVTALIASALGVYSKSKVASTTRHLYAGNLSVLPPTTNPANNNKRGEVCGGRGGKGMRKFKFQIWDSRKRGYTWSLHLGRSEVLRSLRHYLRARSQGHHTIERLEERGVERERR